MLAGARDLDRRRLPDGEYNKHQQFSNFFNYSWQRTQMHITNNPKKARIIKFWPFIITAMPKRSNLLLYSW